MKNILIICLIAFGMKAVAQCPINDILTTRDPQNIANLIENNTDCIKQSLAQNPDYETFKIYLDYLYNSSKMWIYHTNPDKEKLFTDFYATWGKEYPSLRAPAPTSEGFYTAMQAMVATDPAFFAQGKVTKIPAKYKQWLYVQDMNKKYGVHAIINLANAAAKIANLQSSNYSAYISR